MKVLAGLSGITVEGGNKTEFIEKSHTRVYLVTNGDAIFFVDHPWRFREQGESVLSNNSAVE